jgi:hypothetical protein
MGKITTNRNMRILAEESGRGCVLRLNALALEANRKRYEAYRAEQEALGRMEGVVG